MVNPSAWSLAARHLAGATLEGAAAATGAGLVAKLGVGEVEGEDRADLIRLLDVAGKLDRIFAIQSPDMPGLHFFGAEASPTVFGARWGTKRGLSGAGLSPLQAFRRCVGEAVEYLSQHDFGAIPLLTGGGVQSGEGTPWFAALAGRLPDRAIDCCLGHVPARGRTLAVPVDLCWRRSPDRRQIDPLFAPGLGCAAGVTAEAATLAAVLEVIERDALALWWRGGRRARPVSAELVAASGAGDLLAEVRDGAAGRQTWFLDLTTDLGIPVMAAVSVDGAGEGFAFGVAAAQRQAAALTAACLQLGQLELADLVVAAKLAESGEGGLNDVDRMHRRRNSVVSADWPILHPAGAPLPGRTEEQDGAEALIAHLAACGHDVILVDQTTAALGVPVIRALVPSLQPDPGDVETDRLTGVRAISGDPDATSRPAII